MELKLMLKNERVWQFLDGLSDSMPTPGGGSASALSGAMGVALVSMVARLTIENDKYAPVRKEMKRILVQSEKLRASLIAAIDRDSEAYLAVMSAYRMPRETDREKKIRSAAIQKALKKATMVPFEVANKSMQALELAMEISTRGLASAISDVGVGALLAESAVKGAVFNVKINLMSIKDQSFVERINTDVSEILEIAAKLFKKTEANVNGRLTQE
jgi:formiminotetrahydrofolate cyclodeaminase